MPGWELRDNVWSLGLRPPPVPSLYYVLRHCLASLIRLLIECLDSCNREFRWAAGPSAMVGAPPGHGTCSLSHASPPLDIYWETSARAVLPPGCGDRLITTVLCQLATSHHSSSAQVAVLRAVTIQKTITRRQELKKQQQQKAKKDRRTRRAPKARRRTSEALGAVSLRLKVH